nr:HAD family phosphatase [Halomarina salina]
MFDMDGVLVDSEPHWQRFWTEEVFGEAERGTPTLDEVTGRNYRESLAELDAEYGFPRSVEHYARRFEDRAEDIYGTTVTQTPGIDALFDAVRSRDRGLGVVSSSPHAWISTVVDRFDLDPLDVVVSAMDLDGPGKPAPAIYEHAAAELGVEPEHCVVVEDSVHGVRAASDAGATVVRFKYDESVPTVDGVDALAEDPTDLRETVLGLLDEE